MMAKKPKFDRSDKFIYSEADVKSFIWNPTAAEEKQAQAPNLPKPVPPKSS